MSIWFKKDWSIEKLNQFAVEYDERTDWYSVYRSG